VTSANPLSLAFRVIGLVFAVIALVVAAYTLSFVVRSDGITGIVVNQASLQNEISVMPANEQTGVLYYPVIAYLTPGGIERTFTGPSGRSNPQFRVGQEVPLLVSGPGTGEVRLNTLLGVWGTSIILGGLAVLFLFLGLAAPLGFGGLRR